jgi:hypothetical protein
LEMRTISLSGVRPRQGLGTGPERPHPRSRPGVRRRRRRRSEAGGGSLSRRQVAGGMLTMSESRMASDRRVPDSESESSRLPAGGPPSHHTASRSPWCSTRCRGKYRDRGYGDGAGGPGPACCDAVTILKLRQSVTVHASPSLSLVTESSSALAPSAVAVPPPTGNLNMQ